MKKLLFSTVALTELLAAFFKLGRLSNTSSCATTAATLWARVLRASTWERIFIKTAVATELLQTMI